MKNSSVGPDISPMFQCQKERFTDVQKDHPWLDQIGPLFTPGSSDLDMAQQRVYRKWSKLEVLVNEHESESFNQKARVCLTHQW